jgi:hypothetical protein
MEALKQESRMIKVSKVSVLMLFLQIFVLGSGPLAKAGTPRSSLQADLVSLDATFHGVLNEYCRTNPKASACVNSPAPYVPKSDESRQQININISDEYSHVMNSLFAFHDELNSLSGMSPVDWTAYQNAVVECDNIENVAEQAVGLMEGVAVRNALSAGSAQ